MSLSSMFNEPEHTLENAKRLNDINGLHFFEPNTMKFWRSKVHGRMIEGKYFITSEDNYNHTSRRFTVRVFNWETGTVSTLGEFQEFKTKADAQYRINKELAK